MIEDKCSILGSRNEYFLTVLQVILPSLQVEVRLHSIEGAVEIS